MSRRWFRCLRRWRSQPMATIPREAAEPTRGEEARATAETNLDQARARWPEVRRVSESLRDLRERNHFAEQIQHIFEGGPRA